MERVNRQWRLAAHPVGHAKESDFSWTEEAVPEPGEREVLVRTIYLSLDPANRGFMSGRRSYVAPVPIGGVIRGGTTGIVEKSNDPAFQPGDYVQANLGWQQYGIGSKKSLTKLSSDHSLLVHSALLNHIGATAYFGLLDIGQPKKGETLVVSAAAGAVGSLVGQIGKIYGCHVVGIAGTEEKCRWLTDDLGFDAAINYKTENLRKSLKEHCPDGIDIYFENVGGKTLDAVLGLINIGARIPLCGLISQYNAVKPVPGPYNFANVLVQRARIEGFIVFDYRSRYPEAMKALSQWLAEDKIHFRVDIVDGLENAPRALNKLFDGTNKGKLLVKVTDES